MKINNLILLLLAFLIPTEEIFAYVGPGISGGLIASVLGFIGAFFLALFGILYYPIKRMIKKKEKEK